MTLLGPKRHDARVLTIKDKERASYANNMTHNLLCWYKKYMKHFLH
jgi:hypothetical protein